MIRYLLSVTDFYCQKRKLNWMRDRLASKKPELYLWRGRIYLNCLPYPFSSSDTIPHSYVLVSWGISGFTMTKGQILYSLLRCALAIHIREVYSLFLSAFQATTLPYCCFSSFWLISPCAFGLQNTVKHFIPLLLLEKLLPSDLKHRKPKFNWVDNLQIYSAMLTKRKWQMTWASKFWIISNQSMLLNISEEHSIISINWFFPL